MLITTQHTKNELIGKTVRLIYVVLHNEHNQNISIIFYCRHFQNLMSCLVNQHSEKDKDKEVSSIHTYSTPVIQPYNMHL